MLDILPEGEEMLSLIAVAKQQSTNDFLYRLLKAGADTPSWMSNEGFDIEYPNSFRLAVSRLLHAAIRANVPMIAHLLSIDFDLDLCH